MAPARLDDAHDGAYERALRDPAFRARVTAAYSGRHDVIDALWWREHGTAISPSGRSAPAAARARLEQTAFGRATADDPATAPQRAAASSELDRLLADLAAERQAIDHAVRAADAAPGSPGTSRSIGTRSAPGDQAEHEDESLTGSTDRTEPDGDVSTHDWAPSRRRPARTLMAWLAAAALVVGAGAGLAAGLVVGNVPPADSEATSPPTDDSPAALTIFDREQVPSDLPPVLQNIRLRATTLRPLGEAGAGSLFAARDIDDNVCLVLVKPDGAYTATCVPQNAFPTEGITLRSSFQLPREDDDGDPTDPSDPSDSSNAVYADFEAVWLPEGGIRGEETSPAEKTVPTG